MLVVRGAETQTQGFVHAEPAPTVEPHPSHLSSDTCLSGVPAQSSPAYQFTHPARSSPVCQFTPIQAQSVFLLCFCVLLSCHCCFCFCVPPRMSHCLLTFWFPFPERQTRGSNSPGAAVLCTTHHHVCFLDLVLFLDEFDRYPESVSVSWHMDTTQMSTTWAHLCQHLWTQSTTGCLAGDSPRGPWRAPAMSLRLSRQPVSSGGHQVFISQQ